MGTTMNSPVRSFTFTVRCPHCAGRLGYARGEDCYEAIKRSVVVCEACSRRWIYTVTVRADQEGP